jgi:hypothetical protein
MVVIPYLPYSHVGDEMQAQTDAVSFVSEFARDHRAIAFLESGLRFSIPRKPCFSNEPQQRLLEQLG